MYSFDFKKYKKFTDFLVTSKLQKNRFKTVNF